ncbi:hypothetical protein AQUCO_01300448v1 [Aquilegia coerulea]|uniref:Uncharacterized protein n=1 Tax=Aquilegia coerulea TaxID=218851 RepID=A0A2G5E1S3_AQUCA|nr:hypothetical protein AQUCO_01300448v1 [Aquilegia coerulea]
MKNEEDNISAEKMLPPPPPPPPPPQRPMDTPGHGVLPMTRKANRTPMQRKGFGTNGRAMHLLTNHFQVTIPAKKLDDYYFYQYTVAVAHEDGSMVEGIGGGLGRKIINKLVETYGEAKEIELYGRNVAFDGERTLFTIGSSLPNHNNTFTVILEDLLPSSSSSRRYDDQDHEQDFKRAKRSAKSRTFNVEIRYANRIPMRLIANGGAMQEDALRVLDIILRQHAVMNNNPCLLVRQSFFVNMHGNFIDVGGGIQACRGFSSSFHTTQSGLSLIYDISTTVIVKAQSVLKFLQECDGVNIRGRIDWKKAERVLKHLRIKVATSQRELKICGLSEKPCREQLFAMKIKIGDDVQTKDVTIYDYFMMKHPHVAIDMSASLPCINVGKSNRPIYYPMQKALSSNQRSVLVDRTRQKPRDRKKVLEHSTTIEMYNKDPVLYACEISIDPHLTQVQGRVLSAPKLKVGNGQSLIPRDGRWNFMNKKLRRPVGIQSWAVVNFNAYHDVRWFCEKLIRSGRDKGLNIAPVHQIFDEGDYRRDEHPGSRVDKMFKKIMGAYPTFSDRPKFILCFLPEKKNCNLYGPWKRRSLISYGIITQCLAPGKANDQYFTNLLLKINAKLGGVNSELDLEDGRKIPLVSRYPTMILGMDVSHGSPGQVDVPSIAAVVSSREWPLMSCYRGLVKTQPSKEEMIESLCKPTSGRGDAGIIRELLIDFRRTCQIKQWPENIIIFRDGVSDSQFDQVLNFELEQIIKACKLLDEAWNPKFMVIVAQKNHHTRFFVPDSDDNVLPGTIIDRNVCHSQNNDFYLCAHKGILGTSRTVHYHVLLDDIGFSPNELQELVHSLSYAYAHLAAAQVAQMVKSDHNVEVPYFHREVSASMFFC